MIQNTLGRRDFLRLGLSASLFSLASCSSSLQKPTLGAISKALPNELLFSLPSSWNFKQIVNSERLNSYEDQLNKGFGLVALGDGWLLNLPPEKLQSILTDDLRTRLGEKTLQFLNGFDAAFPMKVLPVGVSPWVILFRNGKTWSTQARKEWSVLLNSELKGQIVFPKSPRIIISLAEKIDEPDALRKLRLQAAAFDDQNGLNWVLSGKARAAILPIHSCFTLLSRDPRLSIALPMQGAPLHWTVLVRPATSRAPFPRKWIEESWRKPLLAKLLAKGWIPPLRLEELQGALDQTPIKYHQILLPPEAIWNRCWSFSPLTTFEKIRLENLWLNSTP